MAKKQITKLRMYEEVDSTTAEHNLNIYHLLLQTCVFYNVQYIYK